MLLNRAVEPGFDFATFGLTVKEHEDGTLRIEWPGSDTARLRIADMWRRIVGTDSKLQIRFPLFIYRKIASNIFKCVSVLILFTENNPFKIHKMH